MASYLGEYYARGVSLSEEAGQKLLSRNFPSLATEFSSIEPPAGVYLKYGTAGFRDVAERLDSTFLRMGALAALRSRFHSGAAVGLMVTASHNPERDNGIKLVDADGGMLSVSWESYAQELANAPIDQVQSVLLSIVRAQGEKALGMIGRGGTVCIARDTRVHSPKLAALAVRGAIAMGATVQDYELLTTPQLHHIVRMHNIARRVEFDEPSGINPSVAQGWASEAGYYAMLAHGYHQMIKGLGPNPNPELTVDASGGVGGLMMPLCVEEINKVSHQLNLNIINGVGECTLNEMAGAEFVQKGRLPPQGVSAATHASKRLCSFDGDADRLIYHHFAPDGSWALFDGDKIATLAADFIISELREAGLADAFCTAIVQTAYANGASMKYLRSCEDLKLDFAKTGVKFVHHVATKYDIGIYFEANGHGTVIFKGHVVDRLRREFHNTQRGTRKELALQRLNALVALVNQAVGDAMSDCLLIEAILHVRGWTLTEWGNLYADLPSRQCKLPVVDRSVVQCTEDETRTVAPAGLQEALDAAMKEFTDGRCFARPSGTEDVVRIYAEASTQAEADSLAIKAAAAVYDIAGGVGEKLTGFQALSLSAP